MTFQDHARRSMASALDAVRDHGKAALREELDALRAALDIRMTALENALTHAATPGLENLVEDLSHAAAEQAGEAAARARVEMEEQVRVVRAEAEAQAAHALEIERGANAELIANLEDARRQIEDLQRTAQSHVDARAELETRLADQQIVNSELSDLLASMRAAATVATDQAQGRAADVEAVRAQLHALEAENRQLRRARDDAEARFASAETTSSAVADSQLAERVKHSLRAFSGATSAQAIFDALVAQLASEFATVALFLHRRNRLEGWRSRGLDSQTDIGNVVVPLSIDSPLARAVNSRSAVTIEAGDDGVKLGAFGKSVSNAFAWPVVVSGNVVAVAYVEEAEDRQAADGVRSCWIAEILIEQVGRCLVMGRKPASAAAETSDVAKDSVAQQAGTLAAAKSPRPSAAVQTSIDRPVAAKPAEPPVVKPAAPKAHSPAPAAIVDTGRVAPAPVEATPSGGPAREVERIKMRSGVEVTVDGTTGQLIDLSTRGAQVLSPRSIRPQQLVRLVLAAADGPLPCKGRIAWARFEKTRPSDPGMYRAGVKFSEADPAALQAFLDEFGEQELDLPARAG